MGWFSSAVKWVKKKVVKPVVSKVVEVVDVVGDFVDGALESAGNFIEGLANTRFGSSGTLDGSGGRDLLIGLEFKSIGTFLELSFKTLFSKEFWSSGKLPAEVKDFAGKNGSGLTMNGLGGDDTMFSFGGSVTQNGGAGADRMMALGGVATLNGGAGSDFIIGGSLILNDIDGGSGDDTIIALAAINKVDGGDGHDVITVFGGGNDVDGGGGNDVIAALGIGANKLHGRSGNDVVVALGGLNFIYGNGGNDFIGAAGGANLLYGGGDWDTIIALGGGNWVYGDADQGDVLGSGAGSNDGAAGNDVIVGFGVGNFFWAEGGNDVVTAFGGVAFVDSGAGDDVVVALGGGNALLGGTGDDVLVGLGSVANVISGQDGDDVLVSLSNLDLSFGGAGDDIMIASGPTGGFQMGDAGQDIIVALGGAVRIQFGDNPFTVASGGQGDDDAQRSGISQFVVDTFNGFEFTDFELEDLSLPTLPTLDDLDSGVIGALEGFAIGTWEGLKGFYDIIFTDIPDLYNGARVSFDRLQTDLTAFELPDFVTPDFSALTRGFLNPFDFSNIDFDDVGNVFSPNTPDFSQFEFEVDRFDALDLVADTALGTSSIFTPSSGIAGIGLPDVNSLLPNLSTGFDPGVISTLGRYLPGQDTDTSGLPDLGFANALNLAGFNLPDPGSLLNSVSGLALPGVATLTSLGETLGGIFDFSAGSGLFQPGEGRGAFSLPDLSLPQLSVPSFDLFDPNPGDDSDIMVSLAGASFLFGQEDDDVVIGAGLGNFLFGGSGSDILGGVAKGNLISGGEDDDIAVAAGLVNLVSGGAGSDILGAAGKGNIVAGGTDGDILVSGGLINLMLGGSGSDLIGGGGKLNVIAAGADNDILVGGGKFNVALAGAGDDLAIGGGTLNMMLGGVGNDLIAGGGKFNTAFGGVGNDIVLGGGKLNVLDGDLGDDLLIGGGKFNLLYARAGNDALLGGGTFNTFIGGQGTDLLLGGGKFNTFMSGTEADTDQEDHDILLGGGKYNTFFAGGGDDLAVVGGSLNHVYMGTGQDIIVSFSQGLNMVFGQEDADLIFGAGNGNVYSGGTGNDLLFGFGIDEEENNGPSDGSDGDDDTDTDTDTDNGNGSGSSGSNLDFRTDGSVFLAGDWGDDLLIGTGNNIDIRGGEGQDKLLAGGIENYLRGEGGYDTLISLVGFSALDGGTGNDILYSKGSAGDIGLPSSVELVLDGGDMQGGMGSDLIWANGDDIEVFGDRGESIFGELGMLDDASADAGRDIEDGDDYIVVSGVNSEAYGQGGDDAMLFYGANHRGLGGDGDDLMIAFGDDTYMFGGAGDDQLINMGGGPIGGDIARSNGGAGDDLLLGKGYALLDWMLDTGATVAGEFTQNLTLFVESIGEFIGNTVSSVGTFREFNGSQITADAIYLGRDGLGETPEVVAPTASDIRDAEGLVTKNHILALLDDYADSDIVSFLLEVESGNKAAFLPSYDTVAGDITQAGTSIISPLASGVVALDYLQNMPVSAFVAAAPLAPIFRGGADNDTLGGRLGLSTLMGDAGDDTYLKAVAERVTIIDEDGAGGDDSLTIRARLTDVGAFGLDGIDQSNVTFDRVDGQNDGSVDDLLIRVLSDGGEVRSVTIVLDQYVADSALETLTLTDWLGNEIVLDLASLIPTDVTGGAVIDGNVLSALVGSDEAMLEAELRGTDAYNQMFLFSQFDLEEQAVSAAGDDLNALEAVLDTYFQTLDAGTVDGATGVASAQNLEQALDGRAFDGAPVLEVEEGIVTEVFEDGALLRIRRFTDETGPRYDNTLTANGASGGYTTLHLRDDAPLFEAVARDDMTIGLSGPDRELTVADYSLQYPDFEQVPGKDHIGELSVLPVDGADLESAVQLRGSSTREETLILREGDLSGARVEVSDVKTTLLMGEVDLTLTGGLQPELYRDVQVSKGDTAGQTVTIDGQKSTVMLGEGENVFTLKSGGGIFNGGVDRDTYNIHLDGLNFGTRIVDDIGGVGNVYNLIVQEIGADLAPVASDFTIANKSSDIIDLSGLAEDITYVPLSNGMRLQNENSALNIRFESVFDQPLIIWRDGVMRPMVDYWQSVVPGDMAEFIHVRQRGITELRELDAGGGDDVIISSKPNLTINPGLGDDQVEIRESPIAGSPTINWTGGNDSYRIDYTTGKSQVVFTLGTIADYQIGLGFDDTVIRYLPTDETINIDGLPTSFLFRQDVNDTGFTTFAPEDFNTQQSLTTLEDETVALFDDGAIVPSGTELITVRVDTTVRISEGLFNVRTVQSGTFQTEDGQIIRTGDTLTPEQFLGLRFVPRDDFNTADAVGGDLPSVEAEFRSVDQQPLGQTQVDINVTSVVDPVQFGFERTDGSSSYTSGEIDVPLDLIRLTFSDGDGRYDDAVATRFRMFVVDNTTQTGVLTGPALFSSSPEQFAAELRSTPIRVAEDDFGTMRILLRVEYDVRMGPFFGTTTRTDQYIVNLNITPEDDPEFFVTIPDTSLLAPENQTTTFLDNVAIGTVDRDEVGSYFVQFTYEGGANFLTRGFDWEALGGDRYLHPDGAIIEDESFNQQSGFGTIRLGGTIDQLNTAMDEVRAWGARNFEGGTVIDVALYKVEADGTETLQDSFGRDVTWESGVNRLEVERYNNIILTQDEEGPVEIGISEPFDADFPLDEQPLFPVRFYGLPEFGTVTLADGTPIQTGVEYTSDDLTSLLYQANPDAPNDPDREWAYYDRLQYNVFNPAGSTIFSYKYVEFLVYDDRLTEEVPDGNGGTISQPMGFDFFDRQSSFRGDLNSIFYGGEGNDTFLPRAGIDMMLGRGGADTFIIDEDAGEFNVIGDFEVGIDSLDLGDLAVVEISQAFFFDDPEGGLPDDTLDTVLALSNGSVLVLEDLQGFINTQNVAPSGAEDSFAMTARTGFEDGVPVLTGNVLDNETDANGDVVRLDPALVVRPGKGTLIIDEDGTFSYTPDLFATGQDTFSYVPTDGIDAGRRVTVTIDLERPDNLGTGAADTLTALDAGQGLAGGAGADDLFGGLGDDMLLGGIGPDTITTGAGADIVRGTVEELADDEITDFSDNDVLLVQNAGFLNLGVTVAGDDILLSLTPESTLTLRNMPPNAAFTQLRTDAGVEIRLLPEGDAPSLLSAGGDRLVASSSTTPLTVFSEEGDDAVAGGSGDDMLVGGAGDDVLIGGAGADTLAGGKGFNVLEGGAGQDTFVVDLSTLDPFRDITIIRDFTPEEDILEIAGAPQGGLDALGVQEGGGALWFGQGRNIVLVGPGLADLPAMDVRVVDNGALTQLSRVGTEHRLTETGDTLVVSDDAGSNVLALGGDDIVRGGLGDDTLLGGAGNDDLSGRGGADLIDGGSGVNILTGGDGLDVFRLRDNGGVPTRDTITDFTLGLDRIVLDQLPGIVTLDDIARRDTELGVEFDLGGGRTLVIRGLTSAEQFDFTDIQVIPGPVSASAPTPFAATAQGTLAPDAGGYAIRAFSVSVGEFEALRFAGLSVNAVPKGPISVKVSDTDFEISQDSLGQTSITIDGDAQGPVTGLQYERIFWTDGSGQTQTAAVAVLERAVTADYLLVPFDPATGVVTGQDLPTDVPIDRQGRVDFDGVLTLITEVQANGGILARDDRFAVDDTGVATLDVLENDEDESGDPLTITNVTQPDMGTISTDGATLAYTPDAGFVGSVMVQYDIADGTGLTDTGAVRIDVLPQGYSLLEPDPDTSFAVPTEAREVISLSAESNAILGSLVGLNGDLIQNFGAQSILQVLGTGLQVTDLTVTEDRAVIEVTDTTQADAVFDFTLLGDYSAEVIRVSNRPNNVEIRLEGTRGVLLSDDIDRFFTTNTVGVTVDAGAGDDAIFSSSGSDILAGGDGSDIISAGAGNDVLFSGAGFDRMTGGAGNDRFFMDVADFAPDAVTIKTITDFEVGSDKIILSGFDVSDFAALTLSDLGNGGAIQLSATHLIQFEGMSTEALQADDFIFSPGGRGFQLIASPVVHDLSDANDRFITTGSSANEVRAGGGDDVVLGAGGADVLMGQDGSDLMRGGAGNDWLIGGAGSDSMTGNAGVDRFVFLAGESDAVNVDRITDFEIGVDRVELFGFDLTAPELEFLSNGSGDVVLKLTQSQFVIFDNVTDPDDLAPLQDTFLFL